MERTEYHKLLGENYKFMLYMAHRFYGKNNKKDVADIVHTIIIRLWDKEELNFENEYKLRNYIVITIKNFLYTKSKEARIYKKEIFNYDITQDWD